MNNTATQSRYEELQMHYALDRNGQSPEALVEAIAGHYTRVAQTAVTLLKLMEMRRQAPLDQRADANQAAEYLTRQIRQDYTHSFGLHPNWSELLKPL